jgi:hypothetical protein
MTIKLNGSDLTVTQVVAAARHGEAVNPAARAGTTPRYHAPMQDQSRVLIGTSFRAEGAEAARAPANPFFTSA